MLKSVSATSVVCATNMVKFCCVLLLLTSTMCHGQSCTHSAGCYPPFVDLMADLGNKYTNRSIYASSTCGLSNITQYQNFRHTNDGTIYECSQATNTSRPINPNAYDYLSGGNSIRNYATYWQSLNTISSPTATPLEQIVSLTLGDQFLITKVLISFISPHVQDTSDMRPDAMVIEKHSGEGWTALRYFAQNCSIFTNVPYKDLSLPTVFGASDVYCEESQYSGHLFSRTPGSNIQQVLYNPLSEFGLQFTQSISSQQHYLASGIRLRLVLPADVNPLSSYYAIADLNIQGQCACFGHASNCTGPNSAVCVCEHNTMGKNCELCKPPYYNRPWKMGLVDQSNACQDCGCNGHSSTCHYDVSKGYGVCGNCTHNTFGEKCDQCFANHYKFYTNQNTWECRACNCSSLGTDPAGGFTCDNITGACMCKVNVEGRPCDTCKNGYWGVTQANQLGCSACDCNPTGTYNTSNYCHKTSGVCVCKKNTRGGRCEHCQTGTYNLSASNGDGCSPCGCDLGGSLGVDCSAVLGTCSCKSNIGGKTCLQPQPGYFVPKIDYLTFQAEDGLYPQASNVSVIVGDHNRTLVQLLSRDRIEFNISVPTTALYDFILQYQSETVWTNISATLTMLNGPSFRCGARQINPKDVITLPTDPASLVTAPFTCSGRTTGHYSDPKSCQKFYQCIVSGSDVNMLLLTCPGRQIWNNIDKTCDQVNKPTCLDVPTDSVKISSAKSPENLGSVCLQGSSKYTVAVNVGTPNTSSPEPSISLDMFQLVPHLTSLDVYKQANSVRKLELEGCLNATVHLDNTTRTLLGCAPLEYSIMAELFDGALACQCDSDGSIPNSECDPYTGQCHCQPKVIGRTCNQCMGEHYGLTSSQGCIECGCNPIGSLSTSCTSSGQCYCKPGVGGRECDQCLDQYYGILSGEGCLSCQCSPLYAVNNTCNQDGVCECKPGVGGQLCDQCLVGFHHLTSSGCTECSCSVYGSVSQVCNNVTGTCDCKTNVESDTCSSCPAGFYGLGHWTSNGCINCSCSGHSTNCSSSIGWYLAQTSSNWSLVTTSSTLEAPWNVFTPDTELLSLDVQVVQVGTQQVMQIVNSGANTGRNDIFFNATGQFLGNKQTAYGQYLEFTLSLSTNLSTYTRDGGDVIISGVNTDFLLVASLPFLPRQDKTSYKIRINEDNLKINTTQGQYPSHRQLMHTLVNIQGLYIRGKYSNETGATVTLYSVSLYHAKKNTSENTVAVNSVESCICPAGYTGQFCEKCEAGYTRAVNSTSPFAECFPCHCNGHADGPCDMQTGSCSCDDHTQGLHCDTCLTGYYGNASSQLKDACQPCQCPGNVITGDVNVFAETCISGADGTSPVCVGCAPGHGGLQCEVCLDGWFGQPTNTSNANGQCMSCQCNNKSETCNTTTGYCLNCRDNTTGESCDICIDGYYEDQGTCQACNCSSILGSTGVCDRVTGQCQCLPNVQGPYCDRCVHNAFNYSSGLGCSLCNCDVIGSNISQCDGVTGQCSCKPNVTGLHCDQCQETYYNLNNVTGCDSCDCNVQGISTIPGQAAGACDLLSGQCPCKSPALIGRKCDRCAEFTIGSFPTCTLCGECYNTWARHIQRIGLAMQGKYTELINIWSQYDNLTVDEVGPVIRTIQTNLTSMLTRINTFKQIRFNIRQLSDNIDLISEQIQNLNSTLQLLQVNKETQQTIFAEQQQFSGVVNSTLGQVSPDDLINLTDNHISDAKLLASTANRTLVNIQNLTQYVEASNSSVTILVDRVVLAMSQVAQVTKDGKSVNESIAGGNISSILNQSSNKLHELNSLVENFTSRAAAMTTKLNTLSDSLKQGNKSVYDALNNVTEKHAQFNSTLSESQALRYNATETQQAVQSYHSTVASYKNTMQSLTSNLTSTSNRLRSAVNQTNVITSNIESAKQLSQQVLHTALGDQEAITSLTNEINKTHISEADVNATYEQATNGMKIAEETMNVTNAALEKSNMALEQVKGIQSNLSLAELYRNETEILIKQLGNDEDMSQSIDKVKADLNNITSTHNKTAATIASLLFRINATSQCFVNVSSGSSRISQQSAEMLRIGQITAQVHKQNKVDLSILNTTISNTSSAVEEAQTQLIQAQANATQLTHDVESADDSLANDTVKNITGLLELYLTQKQEMTQLQQDLDVLEDELDVLLQDFESLDKGKTQTCKNP